jgi:hypothetical protein
MKTACVEFKLGNEIKTVLREWGYDFDVLDVSVESLRADKKFAKRMGFKDSKKYKNSDRIPFPRDWLQSWRMLIGELKNPHPYNREAAGDHTIYHTFT